MHKLYYILIFLSVLSTITTLVNSIGSETSIVFMLPIFFLIHLFVFVNIYFDLAKSFVFKIFLLQSAVRYLLLPVLYSLDQNIGVGDNSNYINIAILVMCFELIVIYFILIIFSKKQKKITFKSKLNVIYIEKNIVVPFLLILMFVVIYISGATGKINFIWELGAYVEQYISQGEELEVSTFGMLLFNSFKVILILYLISLIQQSKIIKNKKWFLMLVILASGLVIVGVSRFSIILNVAVLLAMLTFILNHKEAKKVVFILVPFIVFVLALTTIAKFSRYGETYSSDSLITALSMNAYFAGFGNIAIGIEAYNDVKWTESLLYLFNDTLQNVPILSHLTVDEYKTNGKFNEVIYGHRMWADQIVPLSISGLFHFGYIGLLFYSPFFIAIALYMERLAYNVKFIGYKYVFLYLSVVFSLVFMINLGSFYANFIGVFLFIFTPLFFLKILVSLRLGSR